MADNMKGPHPEGEVVNQNSDEKKATHDQLRIVATSHSLMMAPMVYEEGDPGDKCECECVVSTDSSLADGYPRLHHKGSSRVRGEQETKLSIPNGANGQSGHPLRNKSSKENPRRPDATVDQIQDGVDLPDLDETASPTRHQQLGVITAKHSPHSTRATIAGVAHKGATGPEFVEWNMCDSSGKGQPLAHESSLADGYTHMRKPKERNRGERTGVYQSKDRNLENYNSKGASSVLEFGEWSKNGLSLVLSSSYTGSSVMGQPSSLEIPNNGIPISFGGRPRIRNDIPHIRRDKPDTRSSFPEFGGWNNCDSSTTDNNTRVSSLVDGYTPDSSLADGFTRMRKPEERNRGERTGVYQSEDRNLENYNSKGICCFPWARK